MEEKVKMIIGSIIIIGIMILSYRIFPRTAEYEGGVNIGEEINYLTEQLEGAGDLQQEPVPYIGPGGCDSVDACVEYCLIPENEQECNEAYTPTVD